LRRDLDVDNQYLQGDVKIILYWAFNLYMMKLANNTKHYQASIVLF